MNSVLTRVEQALDSIRPFLAMDGGNVRVTGISSQGILHLQWEGACALCPVLPLTRAGVEDTVRKAAPEITAIEVQ
ncbi:MAG: NifU family protein [Hymenobacter sp.]|jgi:Fe-S cluster biogenesis protein NfuA|nr:MAG: NifU family protein [Hymenobacter sp.]